MLRHTRSRPHNIKHVSHRHNRVSRLAPKLPYAPRAWFTGSRTVRFLDDKEPHSVRAARAKDLTFVEDEEDNKLFGQVRLCRVKINEHLD